MVSGNQIMVLKVPCTGGVALTQAPHSKISQVFKEDLETVKTHRGANGMRCSPRSSGRLKEWTVEWGLVWALAGSTPSSSKTSPSEHGSWPTWPLGLKGADNLPSSNNGANCRPRWQQRLWRGCGTAAASEGQPCAGRLQLNHLAVGG